MREKIGGERCKGVFSRIKEYMYLLYFFYYHTQVTGAEKIDILSTQPRCVGVWSSLSASLGCGHRVRIGL